MQSNSALVARYYAENLSEQYLKIFYRNSKTKRTVQSRHSILRKFNVHTAEEVRDFENMFEVMYPGFFETLRREHAVLLPGEKTIAALLKLKLSEKKICRNAGITLEELRCTLFNISKKTSIPVTALREIIALI